MMTQPTNFVNCLIIEINQKEYTFAMQLLTQQFKNNFMARMEKIIEANQTGPAKHRVIWLSGTKQETENIKEMLQSHNIHFRTLRDSFMRRDFQHYFNGKIVTMDKKSFLAVESKYLKQAK